MSENNGVLTQDRIEALNDMVRRNGHSVDHLIGMTCYSVANGGLGYSDIDSRSSTIPLGIILMDMLNELRKLNATIASMNVEKPAKVKTEKPQTNQDVLPDAQPKEHTDKIKASQEVFAKTGRKHMNLSWFNEVMVELGYQYTAEKLIEDGVLSPVRKHECRLK